MINDKYPMKQQLEKLKILALQELSKAKTLNDFNALETKYLGRKGEFNQIAGQIKNLKTPIEKKQAGGFINLVKKELVEKFEEIKKTFETAGNEEKIDVTLPGKKIPVGHLHPITQIQNELIEIFSALGFMALDGPELESDYYCFEALNIPANHPARDMQDTFYIDKKNSQDEYDMVMRTHTSSVQVRAMQKYGAPIRAIVPGRVFRQEATDAVHEHTFYQMEGLMVGQNISIANMIAVMKELLKSIFKKDMETRVRPGYFPFVEPAVELDIRCTICNGAKCPACKHLGWLELMPAGMVHPNVLKHGNIDSQKYSGFAFGLGLTRLAMMKYGIGDIRLFQSGKMEFLEQF